MEELFHYFFYPPASSISKVGRRRRNKEALKARNWTVIEKKFQKGIENTCSLAREKYSQ